MMKIYRNGRYVVIPTCTVFDPRLSLAEHGLLEYLLAMPTHYELNELTEAFAHDESVKSIPDMLEHLEECGYLVYNSNTFDFDLYNASRDNAFDEIINAYIADGLVEDYDNKHRE